MIKKIVLLAGMGAMGLLWGSGDVTIQVINAVKERSITHEFDQKLKKSGLAVHKVIEGGRYIVTLGTYKDEKSAQAALKKARKIVCEGAFVRFVKRDQSAVASQESVKSAIAAVAASHETVKTQQSTAGQAEVKATVVTVAQAHATAPENNLIATTAVKSCPIVKESVISASEKKEVYKSEIAEAISYYKNSPYYRFEPVMLLP